MKTKTFSKAMSEINETYVAEAISYQRGRQKPVWVKITAAACVLCVVCAGLLFFSKKEPGGSGKLPMLTVTNALSDGAGFGGLMAFDISELVNGNPWREETSPATLPVYKRMPSRNERGFYLEDGDQEKKKALLLDTAERLGLDTQELKIERENYGYDEDPATMLTAKSRGITISVDAEMNARIEFEPAVSLPKGYRFTTYASYEETMKTAEYLKKAYKDLIHMEDPQVNIYGGDYTYDLRQVYQIGFYEGSGSQEQDLIHYNFNQIQFCGNDEGKLCIIWINRPDLSEKVGDYPIITKEEAAKLLEKGNYVTSVPEEMPGMEYVAKAELEYVAAGSSEHAMPYYCFYVEVPSMKEDSGLKTYGLYYVPAVERKYISNMPLWDGSFN